MKYTSLGLPAVEGSTATQRAEIARSARKRIQDKGAAEQVISAERRATELRSQLATARGALRKQPGNPKQSGKVERLAANLRTQRAAITRLRNSLSAADLTAVQLLVDFERRQRAAKKKASFERARASRMGRNRGVRLTSGGPIRDR